MVDIALLRYPWAPSATQAFNHEREHPLVRSILYGWDPPRMARLSDFGVPKALGAVRDQLPAISDRFVVHSVLAFATGVSLSPYRCGIC